MRVSLCTYNTTPKHNTTMNSHRKNRCTAVQSTTRWGHQPRGSLSHAASEQQPPWSHHGRTLLPSSPHTAAGRSTTSTDKAQRHGSVASGFPSGQRTPATMQLLMARATPTCALNGQPFCAYPQTTLTAPPPLPTSPPVVCAPCCARLCVLFFSENRNSAQKWTDGRTKQWTDGRTGKSQSNRYFRTLSLLGQRIRSRFLKGAWSKQASSNR